MAPRNRPGSCCGCSSPCNCCTGTPVSMSAAPVFYNPFIGPLGEWSSASGYWFMPTMITPTAANLWDVYTFYTNASGFAVEECSTKRNLSYAPTRALLDQVNATLTPFDSTTIAGLAGVGTYSTSPIICTPSSNFPSGYPGGGQTYVGGRPLPYPTCVSPSRASFLAYQSRNQIITSCGGTDFPWGYSNGAGVLNSGTYHPGTRAAYPGSRYEVDLTLIMWLGTATDIAFIGPECRVHVVAHTYTKWYKDTPPYTLGWGSDVPLLTTSNMAYWASSPITQSNCCSIGSTIPTTLQRTYNRASLASIPYNGVEGHWSTLAATFFISQHGNVPIILNGASIRPDTTLTVTLDFGCPP